jgi:hypothetical protein
MSQITKIVRDIQIQMNVFEKEDFKARGGNKAAAQRARKATSELTKLLKAYRAESIRETK